MPVRLRKVSWDSQLELELYVYVHMSVSLASHTLLSSLASLASCLSCLPPLLPSSCLSSPSLSLTGICCIPTNDPPTAHLYLIL